MLTQDTLNVVLIALVVNGLIVAALILGPRVRNAREARMNALGGTDPTSLRHLAAADAGRPWFGVPTDRDLGRDGGPAAHARLPGLASQDTWATWLEEEAARVARYQRTATIVLVELAGLDRLAERIGASSAERLIPPVADTLRRHARSADRIAQLGPSRFGVLLVETDEVRAINYVERIRSSCDLWLEAGAVALRLSIGWAVVRADRTAEAAFVEAEQRLFVERRRAEQPAVAPDQEGRVAVLQPTGT
jgi:diguanylate cyclase (GGDEF)-like protein